MGMRECICVYVCVHLDTRVGYQRTFSIILHLTFETRFHVKLSGLASLSGHRGPGIFQFLYPPPPALEFRTLTVVSTFLWCNPHTSAASTFMNESPHQPPISLFKYEVSPSHTTYMTSFETGPKINNYKTYE